MRPTLPALAERLHRLDEHGLRAVDQDYGAVRLCRGEVPGLEQRWYIIAAPDWCDLRPVQETPGREYGPGRWW